MSQAVAKIGRKKASALARSIAKGTIIPELEHDHYRHEDLEVPGLDEPNQPQIRALRMALSNRFSLIQGPPGILYLHTFSEVPLPPVNKIFQYRHA